MTPTIPSTQPCPDLEELAAFIDGRLAGHARAAVVAHLASCEDCYEVYAETLRVGEDLEAADVELAPVVRHPRSFPWTWPAAAAALAAAAAVVLVLRLPDFLSTSRSSGELVAAAGIGAQTRLPDDWDAPAWSVTRGGDNPLSMLGPEARSFRIGVRTVDLRAALEVGDRDTAKALAAELLSLLEAEDFPIGNILYEPILDSFESGKTTEELIADTRSAEDALEPESMLYREIGKQIEAARLAARNDHVEYFEGRQFRRFLQRLPTEELLENDAATITELERLVVTRPDELTERKLEEVIRAIAY